MPKNSNTTKRERPYGTLNQQDPRAAVEAAVTGGDIKTNTANAQSLTEAEIASLVCTYSCRGMPQARIAEYLFAKHHVDMHRLAPNRYIQREAKAGRFKYAGPLAIRLAEAIKSKYCKLEAVDVVHCGGASNVAYHVAKRLHQVIRYLQSRKEEGDADSVHIGIAGGGTVRALSAWFRSLVVDTRTARELILPHELDGTRLSAVTAMGG